MGDEEDVFATDAVFVDAHGVRNAAESEIRGTDWTRAWRDWHAIADGDDGIEGEVRGRSRVEVGGLGSQESLTEGGGGSEREARKQFGEVHE